MSISAGVVPNGGGVCTNKETENPPDNPYGNIQNAEGINKTAKGKPKEKSVERQQQQQETESQSGTKKSWVSFCSFLEAVIYIMSLNHSNLPGNTF
jgi:hypothetical protein